MARDSVILMFGLESDDERVHISSSGTQTEVKQKRHNLSLTLGKMEFGVRKKYKTNGLVSPLKQHKHMLHQSNSSQWSIPTLMVFRILFLNSASPLSSPLPSLRRLHAHERG